MGQNGRLKVEVDCIDEAIGHIGESGGTVCLQRRIRKQVPLQKGEKWRAVETIRVGLRGFVIAVESRSAGRRTRRLRIVGRLSQRDARP